MCYCGDETKFNEVLLGWRSNKFLKNLSNCEKDNRVGG
jgi:hypothetical protein